MKSYLIFSIALFLVSCQKSNNYFVQKSINGQVIKEKQLKKIKKSQSKIRIRNKVYNLEVKDSILCLNSNEGTYSLFPISEKANLKEVYYVDFLSLIKGHPKLTNNIFSFHKDSILIKNQQETYTNEYIHKETTKNSISIFQSFLVDNDYNILEYKQQYILKNTILLEEKYSLEDSLQKSISNGCQDAAKAILHNLPLDNSKKKN